MEMHTAEISAVEYIKEYRDVEKFMRFCRECGNYGQSWLCPPFGYDIEQKLESWSRVHIAGVTIDVEDGTPVSEGISLLRPVQVQLSDYLLGVERESGGLAFGFSGRCIYCQRCRRICGEACIHPDKARPSLEAYGFDVDATAKNILGIELLWGKDGYLPPRLALIGAVFMH